MLDELNLSAAKILIVDDQQENLDLIRRILTIEGYTDLTCLTDAREVREVYRQNDFDLVLLDINMPHLDGFEIMGQLNEFNIDDYLPVVIITALADRDIRLRALKEGAMDFLVKPVDRAEVVYRVRNCLRIRLLHRELSFQNSLLEQNVVTRIIERDDQAQQLLDASLEIFRRLGQVASSCSDGSELQSIRMGNVCQVLAQEAGLGLDIAELILNASSLHDIGKIGMPESVLLKPGQLDSTEWDLVKTHTSVGAEILSGDGSELITTAKTIALTHHEKWDGSGYPEGLVGEDIPVVGRIAAIADVFAALTSLTPYKEAIPFQDAIDIIDAGWGTHFDPTLRGAFKQSLPKILDIFSKYRAPA